MYRMYLNEVFHVFCI